MCIYIYLDSFKNNYNNKYIIIIINCYIHGKKMFKPKYRCVRENCHRLTPKTDLAIRLAR